jgi:hypothetical protein
MRSRLAAALPLLLILACAESPTAPEIEAVLPAAGGSMAAQASPSPSPSPSPVANAAWPSRELPFEVAWQPRAGEVIVRNNTDSPGWVQVTWSLRRADGSWQTYHIESAVIGARGSLPYHPDCVFTGQMETNVVGSGFRKRETYSGVGYCY